MKKFQGIIESPTPPPINCFWLYNGTVRYFNNRTGKWESVNSSESNSDILKITISEEDLNKVLNGEQVIIKNNKISPYANVLILESGKYSYYFNKVMQSNGTSQYITGNIHTKNHEFSNLGAIVSEGVITLTSVFVNYSNAGVKAMTNIADVVNGSTTQDTVDVLVGTVNSLLSQLRAVGLIIN